MKIFSTALELRIIKTICDNSAKSPLLLGNLREDLFHTEAASRAFKRISNILASGGDLPSFDVLAEDPVLPETSRSTLKRFKKKGLDTVEIDPALSAIQKYSMTRKLLQMAERVVEDLQKDSVDVNDVMTTTSELLSQVRSGSSNSTCGSLVQVTIHRH